METGLRLTVNKKIQVEKNNSLLFTKVFSSFFLLISTLLYFIYQIFLFIFLNLFRDPILLVSI